MASPWDPAGFNPAGSFGLLSATRFPAAGADGYFTFVTATEGSILRLHTILITNISTSLGTFRMALVSIGDNTSLITAVHVAYDKPVYPARSYKFPMLILHTGLQLRVKTDTNDFTRLNFSAFGEVVK